MRLSRTSALMVAALAIAACDSGGTATPATLPTTSAAPGTSTPATTVTTDATTTSVVAEITTVPATTVPGTIGLSEGGPWTLVDSAPGITTPGLVYELMPKLWVYLPIQEDIANGITWTFNEEDRPIIEAYLQARLVFFKSASTDPISVDDPLWSAFYTDGGASYERVFAERRSTHQVLDLDAGVVLRPVVIGDERTESRGVVFDCMLDGSTWRLPDGSIGPGSVLGVTSNGVSAVADLVSNHWKLEGLATQPEACQ